MKEQKYWFRRKRYGWGWTPVTWEGWLSTIVYLVLVIGNSARTVEAPTISPFVAQTLMLTAIFLVVCWKNGESPRWQWGEGKKDKPPHSRERDS